MGNPTILRGCGFHNSFERGGEGEGVFVSYSVGDGFDGQVGTREHGRGAMHTQAFDVAQGAFAGFRDTQDA